MKRSSFTVALAGIAIASMLLLGSQFPATSQSPQAPVVGEYFAKDSADHYSNDASPPRNVEDYGDSLLIRGPIFSKGSGDRVGSYYVTLSPIRPRFGLNHARLTVRLPGGQIVSEGMFNLKRFPQVDQLFAVVGGTSDYREARGTVTAGYLPNRTAMTFRLFLN